MPHLPPDAPLDDHLLLVEGEPDGVVVLRDPVGYEAHARAHCYQRYEGEKPSLMPESRIVDGDS